MTDAQRTVVQNTSGTNTGDMTLGTANGLSLVGQALSLAAADASNAGALTAGAQSIGGVKTLSAKPVLSAGATLNGTLVGDTSWTSSAGSTGVAVNETHCKITRSNCVISVNEGGANSAQLYSSNHGVEAKTTTLYLYGVASAPTSVAVRLGTHTTDALTDPAARLLSVRTGIYGSEVEKMVVRGSGMIGQSGSDSSASPGAATINKPVGISAIASGATSVVITNSLVAATDWVDITWLGDPGALVTRWWVTRAAGSFTLNVPGAAAANTAFAWEVKKLL